jgi:hypothetical protein
MLMSLSPGYIPSDTKFPGGANTKQVSRAMEVSLFSVLPVISSCEADHGYSTLLMTLQSRKLPN